MLFKRALPEFADTQESERRHCTIVGPDNDGRYWAYPVYYGGPMLLRFFGLGASRRTWSEVGAGGVTGVKFTPARLSWSQLSGVGVNLE